MASGATDPSFTDLGKYRLLERIAAGGMAEVYRAQVRGPEGFEKTVAIKKILGEFSAQEDFRAMFAQEAKIAARLSHPNIVQVFDFGQVGETYFIALELVEGIDLKKLEEAALKQGKTLPPTLCAWICQKVCAGLEDAHTATDEAGAPLGIVHRDISPHNVLLSWKGHVKVSDFGIAKLANAESRTQTGMLKGKTSYMSPEQAEGVRDLTGKSDVFAAGIVLYECLTGRRPFGRPGDPPQVVLRAIRTEMPLPPSSIIPGIPGELDSIVSYALIKQSELRPDATQLRERLEGFLQSQASQSGKGMNEAALAELMRTLTGGPNRSAPPRVESVPPPGLGTITRPERKASEGTPVMASPTATPPTEIATPGTATPATKTRRSGGGIAPWVGVAVIGAVAAVGGAWLGPALFRPATTPTATPPATVVAAPTSAPVTPTATPTVVAVAIATPTALPTRRPVPAKPGTIRLGSGPNHHFLVHIEGVTPRDKDYNTNDGPTAFTVAPGTYRATATDIQTGTVHFKIVVKSDTITKVLLPEFVPEGQTFGP